MVIDKRTLPDDFPPELYRNCAWQGDEPPIGPTKKKISKRQRARVYARDGYRCRYCGATGELTIDHVTPESRGGSSEDDNLVTACRPCNRKKFNRTPAEAGMELEHE